MKEIIQKLSAPFNENEIEWRVGSTTKDKTKGMMLAYVTNRAIMNRLDDVVGPENWKQTFRELHDGVVCALSIRVNDEWITKEDGADLTKIETTKGGISDAMKLAAVQFGIGRYLYDAENVWVDLDQFGRAKTRPTLRFKKEQPNLTVEDAIHKLKVTTTLTNLRTVYTSLPEELRNDPEVIAFKDELKKELSK